MKVLALAITLAGLLGCSDPSSPAVDFRKEGGFTGTKHHLVVDAHGHATSDGRSFDLTAKQRTGLTRALDAARDAGEPDVRGGCADCFVYTIEAGDLSVTYDDAATVPAALSDLTKLLVDLG